MTKRPSSPPKSISKGKRRLFTGIIVVLPVILFTLTEAGLRIAGYGPDLSLFLSETINGTTYCSLNPDVKSRYFTRYRYNPSQPPDQFIVPKPPGTFRIFCLGGSTTVGYPYWYNGSFSSFLRDRLRAVFPHHQLEVVNVGMTATNSFTVNDMARELVRYEPDLLIVYDGHNEYYGALGIASHESLGQYRWLTNVSLRLIHLRTFLLLRNTWSAVVSLFSHEPAGSSNATLMETLAIGQYIPFGSDIYYHGLSIFRDNLDDLKSIAIAEKIPVILGAQVSNFRGMKPFISLERPGLTANDKKKIDDLLADGFKAYQKGDFSSAMNSFEQVIAKDSLRADAHYQYARCLDTIGIKSRARDEYRLAKDYDQLRFRASSDLNRVIRSASDGKNVMFADMEGAFESNSPDSIIGNELITEHLHPNSRGYFILANEYAKIMRENGIMESPDAWNANDTLPDSVLWENRCVTDLDERIAARRTEILTSGWPFQSQFPTVSSVPETDTLGHIVEMVTTARWNWIRAHESAGEYYESRKDYRREEKEYKTLLNQVPGLKVQYYLKLAWLYLGEKRMPEMQDILRKSLDVQPTLLANRALADIALRLGKSSEAIKYYTNTLTFPQSTGEQAENRYLLALAYSRDGSRDLAISELVRVLDMQKGYQPALELLQKLGAKPNK